MQSLRRTAATAARKGRVTLPRQPRRYAHDEHSHALKTPVDESFGKGFWICVGAFPVGYALYQVADKDPNSKSYLNKLIDKYTEKQDELRDINALHTAMMERAGADRILFMHSKPQEFVDMRFPEIMNVGSPYNVMAGSQVNMEKVIQKFKKEAYEAEERKHEALRNNQIRSEQPIEKVLGSTYRGNSLEHEKIVLNRAIR